MNNVEILEQPRALSSTKVLSAFLLEREEFATSNVIFCNIAVGVA